MFWISTARFILSEGNAFQRNCQNSLSYIVCIPVRDDMSVAKVVSSDCYLRNWSATCSHIPGRDGAGGGRGAGASHFVQSHPPVAHLLHPVVVRVVVVVVSLVVVTSLVAVAVVVAAWVLVVSAGAVWSLGGSFRLHFVLVHLAASYPQHDGREKQGSPANTGGDVQHHAAALFSAPLRPLRLLLLLSCCGVWAWCGGGCGGGGGGGGGRRRRRRSSRRGQGLDEDVDLNGADAVDVLRHDGEGAVGGLGGHQRHGDPRGVKLKLGCHLQAGAADGGGSVRCSPRHEREGLARHVAPDVKRGPHQLGVHLVTEQRWRECWHGARNSDQRLLLLLLLS